MTSRHRPGPRAPLVEGGALNATPAEQLRLLDLQSLDARLDLLAHRRATLPEIGELGSIDAELAANRDAIVGAETEAGDVRREQDKFEGDIGQVRERMARDQKRMDAGAVSSAKELESLQHEIDSLHRRQTALEDAELEVMERLEVVEGRLTGLVAKSEELSAARLATQERRDLAMAAIDEEVGSATEERDRLAPTLPSDLLALYDKLRAQFGGVGAAGLRHRRCDGCRLELNATDIGRVRAADEDEVLRCEECRRILVRTPESGI